MAHQWHPPLPPPYGGPPFQFQQQVQTPGQQQFPYNPSAPSSSMRQHYAYPPAVNQSRFDANSQMPNPNSIPPQYSSAGFNPALFHQFANSNLPPPPPPSFPPLPLPNGNFSPFIPPPHMSNHNFQNQYSPHGQPMAPSLQPQQYRLIEQPSHKMEQSSLPQAEKQSEIDMSDGELGNSQASATTMPTQHNNNISADILQRQENGPAASASSDRTDSVSSYNPPSATPPGSGDAVAAAESSNAVSMSTATVGNTSKYQGLGAFEMRELAKGALLSLAPHNVKYSDLLAEGIDAQLLSQLFEEVGLKSIPNGTLSTPATTSTSMTNSSASQRTTDMPFATTNPALKAQPPSNISEPAAPVASPGLGTNTVVQQQAGAPAKMALAATKAYDVHSSASPTMERKDVIAAMLAAKMGKPISRKESPGAGSTVLQTKVTPVSSISANASAPITQTLSTNTTGSFSQALADEPAAKSFPKSRSQAQTELVRQKMEELKRESATKAKLQEAFHLPSSPSASRMASDSAKALLAYSQAGLPPKPLLREVVTVNKQHSPVAPSVVNSMVSGSVTPSTSTFASSIPGLFMMDVDLDSEFFSSRGQNSAVARAPPRNTSLSESTTSSKALRDTQTQHLPAIDLSALDQREPTHRVPSKRLLAVDAFEEQDLPPAKQQDSRPTSSRGLDYALNDGDSDDISEGEIMEIEEGSPVSPLPKAPASRMLPISSAVTTTWSGSDSYTSMNQHRPGSASGLRSVGTDRPSKVNGYRTANPSKHNVELEAIKKKLAEAEERRKAKQIASQLQSPVSSPVNDASVPTSSSPLALLAANAMPISGDRQKGSQQLTPVARTNAQPPLNGIETKSPIPSVPVDSVQRAKELREKLLRQRMLKQGLPELDKEVRKTQNRQAEAQARLAQLRREAEKRDEEAREARKRELEIMEEVKRLEQQLEMGMNGQQQFSQEVETLDQEIPPHKEASAKRTSKSPPVAPQPSSTTAFAIEDIEREDDTPQSVNNINEGPAEDNHTLDSGDSISDSDDEHNRQNYNSRLVRPSAEAALPTAEEEAVFLQPAIVDNAVLEDEDLASPEDNDQHYEVHASSNGDSRSGFDDSAMEVDSDSDGSASMSDSGSEDYQPTHAIVNSAKVQITDDEDEEYDPMNAPISGSQPPETEEDQEDYEPSEVVEPLQLQTPPGITAQDYSNSPALNDTASENKSEHGNDREHGLELTEANTLTTSQELLPSVPNTTDTNNNPCVSEPSISRFTPYQSALSSFKSYRFNPQFTDRVLDGYRSLTYSNAIDPTKPLCPTEAEGGMCADINCEEQHFRQMSLADEKILVQMSSASDIPDKAQRDSFVAGLKLVISDLRTKHISDFDQVASELAAYRRRFRQEQDPSLAFTSDEL